MKTPDSYAIDRVAALSAYTPGEQPSSGGWVKLNTNENPYPPSPAVRAAIAAETGDDGAALRLYPNPESTALRAAIARHHGLDPAQVIAGNGSDDILNILIRAFGDAAHPVGMTVPSYSLYGVLVAMQGAPLVQVPFDRSMALPEAGILASKANLFILTTPNAPTGVGFSNAALARILERYDGIFVADEAYAPFADEDAVPLLARFPNLIVVRTLSKAYGLAGMRVGYALGDSRAIAILDRVRDSYNLDRLAQAAGVAALDDEAYLAQTLGRVRATRAGVFASLEARGWFTYPSQTNFLFTEPRDANGKASAALTRHLFEFLKGRKILVRAFPNHPLTSTFLRITVGTDGDMQALNTALDLWQTNAPLA